MLRLLLATNNPGKLHELMPLLGDMSLHIVTPHALGLHLDVEETGTTYAENARLKAAAFARASGLLTLADDSGLEVDALSGAPGVYSARYAGEEASDADRRAKLIGAALSTWSSLRNKLGGRNMLPILIRSPLRWLFLGTARMLLIFRQVHR